MTTMVLGIRSPDAPGRRGRSPVQQPSSSFCNSAPCAALAVLVGRLSSHPQFRARCAGTRCAIHSGTASRKRHCKLQNPSQRESDRWIRWSKTYKTQKTKFRTWVLQMRVCQRLVEWSLLGHPTVTSGKRQEVSSIGGPTPIFSRQFAPQVPPNSPGRSNPRTPHKLPQLPYPRPPHCIYPPHLFNPVLPFAQLHHPHSPFPLVIDTAILQLCLNSFNSRIQKQDPSSHHHDIQPGFVHLLQDHQGFVILLPPFPLLI